MRSILVVLRCFGGSDRPEKHLLLIDFLQFERGQYIQRYRNLLLLFIGYLGDQHLFKTKYTDFSFKCYQIF